MRCIVNNWWLVGADSICDAQEGAVLCTVPSTEQDGHEVTALCQMPLLT